MIKRLVVILVVFLLSLTVYSTEKSRVIIKKDDLSIQNYSGEQIRVLQEQKKRFTEERNKKEKLHRQILEMNSGETGEAQSVNIVKDEASFSFKSNSEGKLVAFGICHNTGTSPGQFVVATFDIYNTSDVKIGTGWTYAFGGSNVKLSGTGVYTNALYTNDYGYFKVYTDASYASAYTYSCAITYSSYDCSLANANLDFLTAPDFSNYSNYLHVAGTVKNSSASYLTYFTKVSFCIFNSSSVIEDIDFTYIEGSNYNYGTGTTDTALTPGGVGAFSNTFIYSLYSDADSYQKSFEFDEVNVSPGNTAVIHLSQSSLTFSSAAGSSAPSQTFTISNSGTGTLNWNASDNASWLTLNPASGVNSGTVTVTASAFGLMAGTYSGTITVSSAEATNSPQTISVTFNVYSQTSTPPFGEFSTPVDGSSTCNSIPVTGWAVDDVGVTNVKIYNGSSYIGDAVFVEGARPDVAIAYPGYPNVNKAGWGYMMLTQFLPNGGNGTYTLYAKATDVEGNVTTLGSKTITIDNAHAVKPFGAIDTPTQGGTANGKSFVNFGWALTPQPNNIPTNGSTIDVYVDGVNLGHPGYNIYRSDIATLFPGYANTNGAVGYYYLDTTKYSNGIHTIAWLVNDNASNADGIGSRFFSINNSSPSSSETSNSLIKEICDISQIEKIQLSGAVDLSENERSFIQSKELERVQVDVKGQSGSGSEYAGYMIVGGQLKPLPIGSTLDQENGVFYWQPGAGFVGTYTLVFVEKDGTGRLTRRNVTIEIKPKF